MLTDIDPGKQNDPVAGLEGLLGDLDPTGTLNPYAGARWIDPGLYGHRGELVRIEPDLGKRPATIGCTSASSRRTRRSWSPVWCG